MKVAFNSPPLGIHCLDDPSPRRAYVLQLGQHLSMQPGVLDGQLGRPTHRIDQLRVVRERRVVRKERYGIAGALYAPQLTITYQVLDAYKLAVVVYIAILLRGPESHSERRI